MSFTYHRTIRFQDTDAAGVVYFTNVLAICHEAYEASLSASGIRLRPFFNNSEFALPIVHASVDFFRPAFCGDRQIIHVTPKLLSPESFEIAYKTLAETELDRPCSHAITRHVCIHPMNRTRQPLPEEVKIWLKYWGHSV